MYSERVAGEISRLSPPCVQGEAIRQIFAGSNLTVFFSGDKIPRKMRKHAPKPGGVLVHGGFYSWVLIPPWAKIGWTALLSNGSNNIYFEPDFESSEYQGDLKGLIAQELRICVPSEHKFFTLPVPEWMYEFVKRNNEIVHRTIDSNLGDYRNSGATIFVMEKELPTYLPKFIEECQILLNEAK